MDEEFIHSILDYLYKKCTCEEEEREEDRVNAIGCFLKLGCIKAYSSYFDASRFYAVGCVIEQLKDECCIKRLVSTISQLIRNNQLPLKYTSYLVCG